MASLTQRVALVKQSEIHVQLATAQETPDGDASKAVHHYLAAMELLGCAMEGLFCVGPNGSVGASPQFATKESEIFFQVTVSRKLALYKERVDILMTVVEDLKLGAADVRENQSEIQDLTALNESGKNEESLSEKPSLETPPPSTTVDVESGEKMFDDLFQTFLDAAENQE